MKAATKPMEAAQAAAQTEQQREEARRAEARRQRMRNAIRPTDAEDAAITAAALADPDNPPMSDAEAGQFKPARRPRGRPALAVTKEPTTMRLDKDVLAIFKATGNGWQTRLNAVLRKHLVETHQLAE